MRRIIVAAAIGLVLAGPAVAQGLGDVGRLLQEQVLPRQGPDPRQQQERDRAIYEQGRRDEDARRQEQRQRREADRDGDRRFEGRRDDRRGEVRRDDDRREEGRRDDGRRRDEDRFRAEQERNQPRRY